MKTNKKKGPMNIPPAADMPDAPLPPAERKVVPYALVQADPNQPRRSMDEAKLAELAESIRQQGIIQDLVLEFVPASHRLVEPDLHNVGWHVEQRTSTGWDMICADTEAEAKALFAEYNKPDHYRIVCGERRWRAAGMAGLSELPAKVFTGLSDRQRFAMQFIENEQRENVNALEEALALQVQLEDRRKLDTSFSAEKLAAELGMSRAAIYERLKLNRLHRPVREALLAGKISVSVAGEVAKLPTPKAQEALLTRITDEEHWKFPWSVRDVQGEIDSYVKQLDEAPFNQNDAMLCPGVSTCVNCPDRTGNMLEQFPELKSRPNVCTNPDCYAQKLKAHWAAQAQEAAQGGQEVLTEKEFKVARALLTPVDSFICPIGKNGELEQLLGKHAPLPVLVSTDNGLEKYYRKTELPAAFKAAKIKFKEPDTTVLPPQTPEEKAAEAAKDAKLEAAAVVREKIVKGAWLLLAKAIGKLTQAKSWELAEMLSKSTGGYADHEVLPILVPKSETDPRCVVLGRMFADEEQHPLTYNNDWDQEVVDAWKLAGVDLIQMEKEWDKLDKPSELSLKSEPKQKELAVVGKLSPRTKARIIAAQKARWAKIKAKKS